MKKPVSPAPAPRAAALSQSASRFSAGATSTWQSIVGNSPRLAAASRLVPGAARTFAPLTQPTAPGASRVALEPQRAAPLPAPAVQPETTRQVGWREVDRAVGMSAKRKYNVFGIGFGPKVPVFETEKVKLPVYQETDRQKRYYAAVKLEDVARIKREGIQPKFSGTRPRIVEQYNSRDTVHFFSNEAKALAYEQKGHREDYAIVEFVMLEYQDFMLDLEANSGTSTRGDAQRTYILPTIPATCIKSIKELAKSR